MKVDAKGYIVELENLTPTRNSSDRDERITRLAVLKAAAEFVASGVRVARTSANPVMWYRPLFWSGFACRLVREMFLVGKAGVPLFPGSPRETLCVWSEEASLRLSHRRELRDGFGAAVGADLSRIFPEA
jgi:hypothetical protein